LILAACSGEPDAPPVVPERDPAAVQALGDQIMVDPDLAQQNEANAALTGGTDHSIPPIIKTRDAIGAAKQEAADLIGGTSNLPDLPEPEMVEKPLPEAARYSVLELAKLSEGLDDCADQSGYTAKWASRMPDLLPVYPRGNTLEAAGTDSGECNLRAVRYLTPVTVSDVTRFYMARVRKAGLSDAYSRQDEFHILQGGKGSQVYAIYVRERSSGVSEVGLVTSGF